MILITGGTGFIGQSLIRQLISHGYPVRTLIRPAQASPRLPKGVPIDAVVSSLLDERGVRAAMKGVDCVFHLVTGEFQGSQSDLLKTDIQTTQVVTKAAEETGVEHLVFISHLGADRASAYPALKTKGICENIIRTSPVPHTILRSGLVYGAGDHFTEGIKTILSIFRPFVILPDHGETHFQPIWRDDLVSCLLWVLQTEEMKGKTLEVGGPEAITVREAIFAIRDQLGLKNMPIGMSSAYLRLLTVTLESMIKVFPFSTYWLDYFAADRTCAIDSVPKNFGIMPARFNQKINYLHLTKPSKPYARKRK